MAETLATDLKKIDPADAWAPYKPSAAVPWNKKWIAHFYRRAAFGPSPAETELALVDGYEKTLARLMAGEAKAPDLLELLTDAGRYLKSDSQIRAWWLSTMVEGGHPLREKMTLFWHNHFATSYAKVQRTQLMFEQNVLLRKHALGKFRPFLLDMARDTAMLKWLDSNQNVKGAPNENFAREVMELFSLGVGRYSEKDIQEAARAFTGWHVDSRINEDEDTFHFKPVLHDDGPKSVFGKAGNWNGEDIVRLCCDKPDCATFLVGKLYSFLVSETRPPEALLVLLEERFRKSDYDIADLVKAILGSRLFFSQHAYRKRVKWPVEYAIGAIRAAVPGRAPLGDLVDPLAKMGQVLFAPPNVKGWRTGTDWLNSATLLARNNFAETVATGNWPRVPRSTGDATFAKVAPPTTVTDAVEPTPDMLTLLEGPATPAGKSKVLLGSPDQISAAAGALGGAAVYSITPPAPVIPPPGSPDPVPTGTARFKPALPEAPPSPPESNVDPTETLFKPKPRNVAALVTKMGEMLYGEDIAPAARTRIEKFLLDGKKTMSEKDLDNPAFRAKAREALHALMCLPEYQLN